MAKVIVLTGPPGSGKSIIAKKLSEITKNSALISVDQIRKFIKNGYRSPFINNKNSKDQLILGKKNTLSLISNFLKKGFNIFVEDIIITKKSFNDYQKIDKNIQIVLLLPSKEILLKRLQLRKENKEFCKRSLELYDKFESIKNNFKLVIDNSSLTINETIKKIK